MGKITLELIYRQMQAGQDELKIELAALRADIADLKQTVHSLARSDVTIQRSMEAMHRDITALKDRVIILTAAIDEHPPAHV
jgi:predicted  nucleic acid-binding Zn-ribbon protein